MLVLRGSREPRLSGLASLCTCLALLFLCLASALPLWVVTTLKGETKLVVAEIKVNLAIGDGLYTRNMCYGDRPDESVLHAVGLTCDGTKQTDHCEEDDLSHAYKQHCEDFYLMEGMESLAIFAAFAGSLLVSLSRVCQSQPVLRVVLRIAANVMILSAVGAAISVISLLKESDMVEERHFQCKQMLGLELCHGWGASMYLQCSALLALAVAQVAAFFLLVCGCTTGSSSSSYQVVRTPLLGSGGQDAPAGSV